MGDPRFCRTALFDAEGNRSHHADEILDRDVPPNGARLLCAQEQALRFLAAGVTTRCAALEDRTQRRRQPPVVRRMRHEILHEGAHGSIRVELVVTSPARLGQRHQALIVGCGKQRLPGGKAAIQRADPDFGALGDVVERGVCSPFQEHFFGCRKDALAIAGGIGP